MFMSTYKVIHILILEKVHTSFNCIIIIAFDVTLITLQIYQITELPRRTKLTII